MNAGFRSALFVLGISVATFIPPVPPVFEDLGGSPQARRRAHADWLRREAEVTREIEQQNLDDIEVVRILTEFLSRM